MRALTMALCLLANPAFADVAGPARVIPWKWQESKYACTGSTARRSGS